MTGALVIPPSRAAATVGFDYARLDPETATEARGAAARIREFVDRGNEVLLEIGRELSAVKDRLGHGHFGAWIADEFDLSIDSAERCIRATKAFGDKIRTVRNLQPTTLYRLSAKSTPASVQQEIIARLEAGEGLSDGAIRKRISEAKDAEKEEGDRRSQAQRRSGAAEDLSEHRRTKEAERGARTPRTGMA